MKIYSAYEPGPKTTLYDIRRYIGKEVWVWCDTRHGVGYCRFLNEIPDADSGSVIEYNFIRSETKTEMLSYSASFLGRAMNGLWDVDAPDIGKEHRLQIITPLHTITTREILDTWDSDELNMSLDYDPNIFNQFIGKDLWVLCERSNYSNCYAKILSQTSNSVTYQMLLEELVPDGFPGEDIDPSDRIDAEQILHGVRRPKCTHKSGIRIIRPVEAYTTDEIQELLDRCNDYVCEDYEGIDDLGDNYGR